jgi:hypothetical protein
MVQTVADPGQISVPMSSILDALEDILTDAERTKLFETLIGLRPAGVSPGDLITAELFNQVLADLNDLAQRVAVLEGESDQVPHVPIITQIVPQIVMTGQKFTVYGKNLNAALLSRIDIDTTNLKLEKIDKQASTPTRLVLEAPAIMTLPGGGKRVAIAISNPAGTGTGEYFQQPGQSTHLEANMLAPLKAASPKEKLKANTKYDLTFEITIFTSLDERFILTAQSDNPTWKAEVKDGAEIDAVADANQGFKVTKTITVTTGPSGSALLTPVLDAINFQGFSMSAVATSLKLNEEPLPPTDKIASVAPVAVTSKAKNVNGTIQILKKPASLAPFNIQCDFIFQVAGEFNASAPVVTGSYTVEILAGQGKMQPNAPGGIAGVAFKVTPASAGQIYTAGDGDFSFAVTSKADPTVSLPVTIPLKIVDALP